MTKGKDIKSIEASIKERLLNIARSEQRDYQAVFKQYIQERMLYRISVSSYANCFILKGALLFLLYDIGRMRPTKDIDLMGYNIPNDLTILKDVFKEIAVIESNDGLIFIHESIKAVRIIEEGNYKGIRISLEVKLDKARDRIQIDIGYGDKIYKGPVEMYYPVLLDHSVPLILAYTIESAIAEKYEAIVSIGIVTSRMKDFYDIIFFANKYNFESKELFEAIQLTFGNRNTDIAARSIIYDNSFKSDAQKQTQWKAFLFKNKLEGNNKFENVVNKIHQLIEPLFDLTDAKTWNHEKWRWE